MCLIPPGTPCFDNPIPSPLNTQAHLFLDKNIALLGEYYMNKNTLRIVFRAVLTLSLKNDPNFLILMIKIANLLL